jgi:hypothetical protein
MAETFLERFARRFEETFPSANRLAGVCNSYTLDQMRDLLKHGASISNRAKGATAFVQHTDILGKGGDKLAESAQAIDGLVKKGSSAVGDTKAACEISEAVDVLNKWNLSNSTVTNQEAAKAFDKMFGGASRYFEKLPPPINAYSQIFSTIAEFSFFSNMQRLMDPENPNSQRGRRLKEIYDSIDK